MKISGLVEHRVRGFRVVDLAALAIVLTLALTVYAFKTSAGSQTANIADVEDQIHDQTRQVRLLRAEIAHLESPARLERLATQFGGQAPVDARQEIAPEALPQVAVQVRSPAGLPTAQPATAALAAPASNALPGSIRQ